MKPAHLAPRSFYFLSGACLWRGGHWGSTGRKDGKTGQQASSSRRHSWSAAEEEICGFTSVNPGQVLCRPRLATREGKLDPVLKPREHPALASCGVLGSVKGQHLPGVSGGPLILSAGTREAMGFFLPLEDTLPSHWRERRRETFLSSPRFSIFNHPLVRIDPSGDGEII